MAIKPGSLIGFEVESSSFEYKTSSNWLKLPGDPYLKSKYIYI
jgi:hypothetical protein